jgi:hypothetical protein
LNNFELELTPPSNIKEVTEIDLINQKMSLLQNIQALNLFSNQWMLKKIMRLSDKEIADIMLFKKLEGGEAQPGMPGAGGPGAMPGGEMMGGGGMAGMPPEVGMPPAGPEMGAAGMGAGAGTPPPVTGELAASTMINMFGKEFIVENKDDFFKLVRLLEDWKKASTNGLDNKLMLEIANYINPKKKRKYERTRNITRQFIINEMGGLDVDNRVVKLFESTTKIVHGEKIKDFRVRKIHLRD